MKRIMLLLTIVLVTGSGCGTDAAQTQPFTSSSFVSALTAAPDGGLQWANGSTGQISSADKSGHAGAIVGKVDTLTLDNTAVTGLVVTPDNKTFAAWIDPQSRITVGRVDSQSTHIIWQGPLVSPSNVAGSLTVSPDGRIVVGIGANAVAANDSRANAVNGKLLSLDPNGDSSQLPNSISSGWMQPTGIAYSADNVLWVADYDPHGKGHLAVAGTNGPTGQITNFSPTDHPVGLTAYGDQEMAVCLSGNHQLKRYLLSDGVQALPGRVLANDCQYGVTQLKDGRLAYATSTGIRVTVL
jgi:hypothetical protein